MFGRGNKVFTDSQRVDAQFGCQAKKKKKNMAGDSTGCVFKLTIISNHPAFTVLTGGRRLGWMDDRFLSNNIFAIEDCTD